jgi:hypothetical protein
MDNAIIPEVSFVPDAGLVYRPYIHLMSNVFYESADLE